MRYMRSTGVGCPITSRRPRLCPRLLPSHYIHLHSSPSSQCSIKYLIDKYRMHDDLSFLKIDIEGAEASLLAPESHPEAWLPHVTCLSIEIHDRDSFNVLPPGWRGSVFVPLMRAQGFEEQEVEAGELQVWCHPDKIKEYQ